MADRSPVKTKCLSHEHREKIQTAQLINRLQNFSMASPDDTDWKTKSMTPEQIRAALGLLKKTLPDLQGVIVSDERDLGKEHIPQEEAAYHALERTLLTEHGKPPQTKTVQ